jgi:hypothetical protein
VNDLTSVEELRKWGMELGCHLASRAQQSLSILIGLRLMFRYPNASARMQPPSFRPVRLIHSGYVTFITTSCSASFQVALSRKDPHVTSQCYARFARCDCGSANSDSCLRRNWQPSVIPFNDVPPRSGPRCSIVPHQGRSSCLGTSRHNHHL